jgi:hypothetical protein
MYYDARTVESPQCASENLSEMAIGSAHSICITLFKKKSFLG